MASKTLNLRNPVRFVAQVTNGCARTKYSYQGMQTELLGKLKTASWRKASCNPAFATTVPNKVTETDRETDATSGEMTREPTYTAFFRDYYDAFKQGGDAVAEDATFCGYAGMAAYRYALPSEITTSDVSPTLDSITVSVALCRYCRSGVRLHAEINDSPYPNLSWSELRGTATSRSTYNAWTTTAEDSTSEGVKAWGRGGQNGVATLLASTAREIEITLSPSTPMPAPPNGDATRYLWLYLTLEDYEDWWTLYNATTPRYYSIEGSAHILANTLSATFSEAVSAPAKISYSIGNFQPVGIALTDAQKLKTVTIGSLTDSYAGATGPGIVEAYGERFLFPINVAEFYSTHAWRLTDLLKFTNAPSKPYHTYSFGMYDRYDPACDVELPIADVGVLACQKVSYYQTTDNETKEIIQPRDWWYYGSNGFVKIDRPTALTQVTATGVLHPTRISFASPMLAVAGGRGLDHFSFTVPHLSKISVSVAKSCDVAGGADMIKFSVNVWKCNSQDVYGPYGGAAIASLVSQPGLYSNGVKTVKGSMQGDGALTSSTTVTAEATYITNLPLDDGQYTCDIEGVFEPGDVLIFAPKVEGFDFPATSDKQPSSLKVNIVIGSATFEA